MTSGDKQPFLYLAPIKGITDALFRHIATQHFTGLDATMAPFINPQKKSLFDDTALKDILPENNRGLPLVPQLLHTDPEDFLCLAERIGELGYSHINWNLGCPVPMVARKKRGSGMLPYPDLIVAFLEKVLSKLKIELSIKTRLGYENDRQLEALLPKLDMLPLKEIILHTRTGKQLYKGTAQPDGFERCLQLTRHDLVYNGDICDQPSYHNLAERFGDTTRWMIGRGFLENPFTGEEIKGRITEDPLLKNKRLQAFHQDLYSAYKQKLSGPGHLLGRMKLLWGYLIKSFPDRVNLLKKIQKCTREDKYLEITEELFSR